MREKTERLRDKSVKEHARKGKRNTSTGRVKNNGMRERNGKTVDLKCLSPTLKIFVRPTPV